MSHLNHKHHKVFYGWWIVGACVLTTLYAGGVVSLGFTAIFEPIVNEFGWSYAQVSLAASLRGLETGILAPIVGLLVDRLGSRKLLLAGAIISGLGLILLSRINSLGMFYGAYILIAMGMSACTATVVMAAVVNWFRRKMAIAIGIVSSGFALGGLLVPLVTTLIDMLGWRTAMAYLGLGMWVIGIPLSLLVRHRPEPYGYLPDGDSNSTNIDERLVETRPVEVSVGAKQAIMSSTFWHITLALTCLFMIVGAVNTHVMPYLSSIGIDRTTASLIAAVIPLASIIGRIGFGWLADKFDKRQVAAGCLLMVSLGLLLFSYASTPWLFSTFILLFGIGWGGCVTMRVTLLGEYFGRTRFGTIHGFVMGMLAFGQVVGTYLPGWAYDNYNSYQGTWLAFAGLAVVALAIMITTPPFHDKT